MKASFTPSLLVTALAGLLLAGCSNLSSPDDATTASATSAHAPDTDQPVVYGQFRQDTLYDLLTAEIAGQRNRFDIAIDNYLHQAEETRDPGVVERAMRVAEFLGAESDALQMAQLWAAVAPDDPEAMRSAAIHLARAGQHEQAMDMMRNALELHGETHFDFLALAAADTDPQTRQSLLSSLRKMQQRYPENTQLVFSRALLLQQQGRNEEALNLFEAHPDADQAPPTILLHSRLLAETSPQRAEQLLYSGLENFPDDIRMRLMLARLLVSDGNFTDARVQYMKLARDNPDEPDLLLSLGLINLELNNPDEAIVNLQHALQMAPGNNTARYHLGNAYQANDQPEEALRTWQSIDSGNELLTSRVQMARVLLEHDRIDELGDQLQRDRANHPQHGLTLFQIEIEALFANHPTLAMQRANAALQAYPQNTSLLYSRAMLHEKLGDLTGAEQDLSNIIAHEPDNAMALNALGYTLADRNERLDRALELIKRAAELEPDDPAVEDSLGWVHYRLGNLDLAEELLRSAYQAMPDPEVAAHLGEVLWRQGRKWEARRIWRKALKAAPDNSLIPSTRQRLEAE